MKGKQCVKGRQWDRPRAVEVDRPRAVEVDRPRAVEVDRHQVEVERSGKPKTGERKTCSQKGRKRSRSRQWEDIGGARTKVLNRSPRLICVFSSLVVQ